MKYILTLMLGLLAAPALACDGELLDQDFRRLASTDEPYREISYGCTVGLRFHGSSKSLPVLEQIAENDIIREVRQEAIQTMKDIRTREQLAAIDTSEDK